mmetsp:Transcript_17464/g.24443  ORF Transcript_17464/g.24443 Transcript_17464/m.24443 type:complete len:85 (-) Transcript_17464:538-792(-)
MLVSVSPSDPHRAKGAGEETVDALLALVNAYKLFLVFHLYAAVRAVHRRVNQVPVTLKVFLRDHGETELTVNVAPCALELMHRQ